MKVILNSLQCPKCSQQAFLDVHTGPGKWYWCNDCGDYVVSPKHTVSNGKDSCNDRYTKP